MPGDDIAEALRTVLGELPALPHLPELPDRGAGADLIGRSAGLLADLPVDLQVSAWRMTDRPGRELRRTLDLLDRDLDTLAELAGEYGGPFKIQAAGPWTLAANIELRYGDKVLADHGAVRELASSLAEGLAQHDEPSLPAVLAAEVPTASGFGRLRAVRTEVATSALAEVVRAAGAPVAVHCCAPAVPVELIPRSGAVAVSMDLTLPIPSAQLDALAGAIDAGLGLWAGVVPSTDAVLSAPADTVSAVRGLWRGLGFKPEALAGVVITPTCGLAGAGPAHARAALARCREAARTLVEYPEG
jgi:hypothetical protein